MRVCLFTDTLADVNGVSRFIRSVAALGDGRVTVLTSTRVPMRDAPHIENFAPCAAMAMPGYPGLELALPPWRVMARRATTLRPDAVHISTPGPVGFVGLRTARRLGVPVLGVYHTDFPAYIDHLFGDEFLTGLATRATRRFYRGFARVFTRSAEYAETVERLGVERSRIVRLRPGIDVARFQPAMRDDGVWTRLGVPAGGPVVLYVGRVSVEKNLPLLARAWKRASTPRPAFAAEPANIAARLVVIGDGPYLPTMKQELAGCHAWFPGFVHGADLSAAYASADLFAFPSATDTLGQVVMEAQSAGLPVLVSDRGGPREVVRHGETGLVLPAGSAGAWADAIAALTRDGARRRAMGSAAHRSVQPMTIAASFEHFWSVHEEAVAEHRTTTSPRGGPGAR